MKKVGFSALFVGLGLLTGIIIWQGIGELLTVFGKIGGKILYLVLYYILPLTCTVWATYILFPRSLRPKLRDQWFGNLLVNSVNWLLPVAQIGGWIARVHWLSVRGTSTSLAGASAIVDLTLQALAQGMIGILGLTLLVHFFGQEKTLITLGLLVVVLLLGLVYIFYRIQNNGIFSYLLVKIRNSSLALGLAQYLEHTQSIDLEIKNFYVRRHQVVISALFRFTSRILFAGEIWIVFYFVGYPISMLDAILLESLGQTVRAASFFVPGSYGIQEGGYIALGLILGLPTSYCLAMALTKRVRELLVGGITLLFWQWREGKSILNLSGISSN